MQAAFFNVSRSLVLLLNAYPLYYFVAAEKPYVLA
jgi:hypothetical protein